MTAVYGLYDDPHVAQLPKMRHHPNLQMSSTPLTREWLAEQDCVLIITDHTRVDYQQVVEHAQLVVDTRNVTANTRAGRARIVKA